MDYFLSPLLTFEALLSGILFGFLLRKATVSRFDTIVGQLLLKDFTVMKVMLTAIVTGSCGIYLLQSLQFLPTLHLAKTPILWAMIGGSIFGIGMAIAGYCPGTSLAALGEGSKDVIFAFLGMLVGALLFNICYPYLRPLLEHKDFFYQETWASFFQTSPFKVIAMLIVMWNLFALGLRKWEQRAA